jgi:hypothetical protein
MEQPAYGTAGGIQPSQPNGEWDVEDRLRAQAVRNLRKRAEFRTHLVAYALVNTMIVAIWLVIAIGSGAWFPWFVFPMFGWGIGLGTHAWAAYRGDEINEARIRAEMRRIAGT